MTSMFWFDNFWCDCWFCDPPNANCFCWWDELSVRGWSLESIDFPSFIYNCWLLCWFVTVFSSDFVLCLVEDLFRSSLAFFFAFAASAFFALFYSIFRFFSCLASSSLSRPASFCFLPLLPVVNSSQRSFAFLIKTSYCWFFSSSYKDGNMIS